ncbi:MAG TPA: ABC transporter permease, partial [Balneolaceae bacterium]|nr:ABC transporter permease [Balneolaceae bacterium]
MSFRQIFLVLKREYLTRIRSKAFIIATILIPVAMITLMGVGIGIAIWDSGNEYTIGIVDETESLYPRLEELAPGRYEDFSSLSEDSLRSLVMSEQIDGYIFLTEAHITEGESPEFISSGAGGISLQSTLSSDLREVIRSERLERADVSADIQAIYESEVDLITRKLTEEGKETEDNSGFLTAIGMIMGVIIFGSVLGYGGLITRSVIEEKTNRIVEVIASSVKPIELLLGKMGGVGALALTQIGIWLATFFGLAAAAGPVAGMLLSSSGPESTGAEAGDQTANAPAFTIPDIDPSLIVYFVIFFILGYLIYSALFAAIGSAVDSEADTQQYMMPIMVPIMIAYFILI